MSLDKYDDVLPETEDRDTGAFEERYGERLDRDEIRRLEDDLASIRAAFEKWRTVSSWTPEDADEVLGDLAPAPEAVREFCEDRDLKRLDGTFVTALATRSPADTVTLPDMTGVAYVGRGNSGTEIVVEGDAGPRAAEAMESGRVVVRGDAEPHAGAGMEGGTLVVEGDAAYGLGRGMTGGTIRVEGGATVHADRSGGEIHLPGEGTVLEPEAEESVDREPRLDPVLSRAAKSLGDRFGTGGRVGQLGESLILVADLPASVVEGPLHRGKEPSGRSHRNHVSLSKKTLERARYARLQRDEEGSGVPLLAALAAAAPLLVLAPAGVAAVWTLTGLLAAANHLDRRRT